MKKNLRRICLLLIAMIMIGKKIFATSTEAGENGSIFSGSMKFIFAGVAGLILVLVLYLSYKLDKEEPLMKDEGKVSKKKLTDSKRNKSKKTTNEFSNPVVDTGIDDDEFFNNDELYEDNIKQSDFESEEVAGFKDDASEEKIVQKMDDYSEFNDFDDEDNEDNEEIEELKSIDDNSNNIPDYLEDDFNNISDYSEEESEELENEDTVEDVKDNIENIDEDDEFSDLNNDITKAIQELEEDSSEDISKTIEDDNTEDVDDSDLLDDVESEEDSNIVLEDDEKNDGEEAFFDTSVLDDIEDYENPPKKNLSSSSMPSTPKANRFSDTSNNSEIGFRNKKEENSTEGIGFKRKIETPEKSEIGFERKVENVEESEELEDENKSLLDDLDSLDDFDSNDFLKNIDDTIKASTTKTTSKKKKVDSVDNNITKTETTTKKKKI